MVHIRDLIAAASWDRSAGSNLRNWWSSETLRHYINEQICGEPGREDGVAVALDKHLGGRKLARGLSIGCGNAAKELALLKSGIIETFDLFDISSAQVAAGKRAMVSAGLGTRSNFLASSPLDHPGLPAYDLIYWDHSLHHMADVRATLDWCKASLLPGGILCINDYVGPARLQWTADEVTKVNSHLKELDAKHAVAIPKATKGNAVKRLRLMLRDPSEAPQSHLIEDAVSNVLPGFQLRPLGGAMLNICGSLVMNLPEVSPGLAADFAHADKTCLESGLYHFAFGIWEAPN